MISEEQERNNLVGSVGLSWCTGCVQPIHDKYVHRVAPNLQWHAACLKCHSCQELLADTCFLRDRLTYCKKDYVRLFGTTCRHCATGFQEDELVVRTGPNFVYHTNCFRCVVCRRRLLPGEEFALGEAGPCCHEDHSRLLLIGRSANGGGESIGDSGGRSSRCSDIESGDVMEGGQKDVKPFLASSTKGDFQHVVQQHVELCPTTGDSYATPPRHRYSTTSQSTPNTGSTNESPSAPGKTPGNLTPPLTPRAPGARTHRTGQSKSTRIRTVMSEMQLHTLRTCYAANPRPDALVKEQLVEMTGLTSRVIRVWFQNKRCKDKKRTILLKQLEHQIAPDHGPMVVSSPIPLPSPAQSSSDNNHAASDAQSISWQDISDFAFREHLESSLYPHNSLNNNNVISTSSVASNGNQKLLPSDVIRESMTSYVFDYHGDCPRQQEDDFRSLDNANDDIYREEYHSAEEDPPPHDMMGHVTSRDELRAAMQQMCGVGSQ